MKTDERSGVSEEVEGLEKRERRGDGESARVKIARRARKVVGREDGG